LLLHPQNAPAASLQTLLRELTALHPGCIRGGTVEERDGKGKDEGDGDGV